MSKSYEDILKEVLNNAPPGIDTRQGSIYYDSVAGICLTIARLYTDIETQGRLVTIVRAVGEELTVKAAEYGIARHPAAPAKYHFSYEGEKPSVGERFLQRRLLFRPHVQRRRLLLPASRSSRG